MVNPYDGELSAPGQVHWLNEMREVISTQIIMVQQRISRGVSRPYDSPLGSFTSMGNCSISNK